MSKMKIAAALLGGLLTSAYAGGAQANVTFSDFNGVNGPPPTTSLLIIDNFTVTTSPGGVFEQKQLSGFSGVGVSGGSSAVPGEIDGQEYIRFVSNTGNRLLSAFTVSFLYATPAYGDIVNESANITIGNSTYLLSLSDATHASFSFGPGATVTMLSEGSEGFGGAWEVKFTNPLSFASIQFSPGPNGGATSPQADYAFGSLTTAAAVPGPIVGAGLPGLMMALGGLVVLARRRRHHAGV